MSDLTKITLMASARRVRKKLEPLMGARGAGVKLKIEFSDETPVAEGGQ